MASSNISLASFQIPLLKSHFLGTKYPSSLSHRPTTFINHKPQSSQHLKPCAKFNLSEILGGRGLCNGEIGILQELNKDSEEQVPSVSIKEHKKQEVQSSSNFNSVSEDAFEKELMGLTGGFPGGEKGLMLFLEKNPLPDKNHQFQAEEEKGLMLFLEKNPLPDKNHQFQAEEEKH